MDKSDERYGCYVAILEEELVCAMGCTEPIAIAYAAARARELLGARPDCLVVSACGSIIKNAKSVVVPHTGGLKGIEAAAAAGVVAGRPECELEVIAEVGEDDVEAIVAYLAETPIEVKCAPGCADFDIVVRAFAEGADAPHHEVLVHIADYHTNVVREERDGAVVFDAPTAAAAGEATGFADRSLLTMEGIWDFAMTCDLGDVRHLVDRQAACNDRIADEGLSGDWGANIGQRDAATAYGARRAARAPALRGRGGVRRAHERLRAAGRSSISGSGNQGITVVRAGGRVYAKRAGRPPTTRCCRAARCFRTWWPFTSKTGIGRLSSAYCGAVCAAGGGRARASPTWTAAATRTRCIPWSTRWPSSPAWSATARRRPARRRSPFVGGRGHPRL